jgi:hypothetical protein
MPLNDEAAEIKSDLSGEFFRISTGLCLNIVTDTCSPFSSYFGAEPFV